MADAGRKYKGRNEVLPAFGLENVQQGPFQQDMDLAAAGAPQSSTGAFSKLQTPAVWLSSRAKQRAAQFPTPRKRTCMLMFDLIILGLC